MKIKSYLGMSLIMLSGAIIINMFFNNRTAWLFLDLLMVLISVPAGYFLIKDK